MLRRLVLPAAACGAILFAVARPAAQAPSAFFDQNCAPCHTVGQGAGAGPDLRDVTKRRDREWLIRFLVDPDDFKTDPAVAQMIKEAGGLEMPPIDGVTREMAAALLDLIEHRSASSAAYGGEGAAGAPATPEDIAHGVNLFTGRTRLVAGGPDCVQCHDAATLASPGGGRMGPDLTLAARRLGAARGLTAWLGATPTPVMRSVYHTKALTPDEARLLAAFLEDAAGRAPIPARTRTLPLVTAALVLGAMAVGVIGALGSQRFRGVRGAMVARAVRRSAAAGGSR